MRELNHSFYRMSILNLKFFPTNILIILFLMVNKNYSCPWGVPHDTDFNFLNIHDGYNISHTHHECQGKF
jgi:hypothetical protein